MLDATELSDARPHAKASASKAALGYLRASGAVPICVTADLDGVMISASVKADLDAAAAIFCCRTPR